MTDHEEKDCGCKTSGDPVRQRFCFCACHRRGIPVDFGSGKLEYVDATTVTVVAKGCGSCCTEFTRDECPCECHYVVAS